MRLRFIGANGSLGLTNGEVYEVQVGSDGNHIWVEIPSVQVRYSEKVSGVWKCAYSSPKSFAANWEGI